MSHTSTRTYAINSKRESGQLQIQFSIPLRKYSSILYWSTTPLSNIQYIFGKIVENEIMQSFFCGSTPISMLLIIMGAIIYDIRYWKEAGTQFEK